MRGQSQLACWALASASAVVFGRPAQEAAPARVTVYETVASDRATYHYAVTNKNDRPIVRLEIGEDTASGELTLTPPPVGWTPDGATPRTIGTPAGWAAEVIRGEDTSSLRVDWFPEQGKPIAPGQTMTGFSIALRLPADVYRTTGWHVVDDLAGVLTGELERVRAPGAPLPHRKR
jgi:hypothetical protein